MPKQGDIILTPFPFTDLSGKKVRPALVLAVNKEDILVCFISSIIPQKILKHDVFIKEENKCFQNTGLKVDSLIKVMKIATLERKIILGKLGVLDKVNLSKIKIIIKKYFNL